MFSTSSKPTGVQTMLTKCLELQTMNKQLCHVNIEALKVLNISKKMHEIERPAERPAGLSGHCWIRL